MLTRRLHVVEMSQLPVHLTHKGVVQLRFGLLHRQGNMTGS